MKLCDSCPAECEACPAGSYGKDVDIDLRTSESGACEKCDVGKYSAAEGASGCNKCPPGTASNVEGTRTIVVGFLSLFFISNGNVSFFFFFFFKVTTSRRLAKHVKTMQISLWLSTTTNLANLIAKMSK